MREGGLRSSVTSGMVKMGLIRWKSSNQEVGVKLQPVKAVGFPGVCEKKNLKTPKSVLLEEGGNVLSSPGVKNNTEFSLSNSFS